MKRVLRVMSALLLLVLAAAGTSRAVPLTDLLGGGSLTVGDKLFDGWMLIGQELIDTTGAVDLANIDVTGIDDPLNPGLLFNAGDELQLSGDNFIDLYFGFHVSVLDPGMLIKGVSFNFMQGAFGGDGFHAGIEDVLDSTGGLLGSIGLEASNALFLTGGSADFVPQREIWVEKNILLYGFAAGDSTALNSFTQRFSQTQAVVPEPGTAVLLGSGLLGAALVRRKKK